jgi:uncharacterized repeat protein (TIGR03803 family)
LYGTATNGGANNNDGGTVFALNIDGTSFTTLYGFTWGDDGGDPQAGLIQGTDGRLYGMAEYGGPNENGSVFAVNPDGTGFTTLYDFTNGADGSDPQTNLSRGTDGRLYGSTYWGGVNYSGTLFAISGPSSSQSLVAGSSTTFTVTAAGADPLSYQWQFDGGSIAGAINAIFSLTNIDASNAGSYDVIVSHPGGSVTSNAFTLTIAPPPPSAPVFSPPAGAYSNSAPLSVGITSAGATSIYYTTNGAMPTETTGNLYSGPLTLSAATTLTAIGVNSGGTSPVASGSFTFIPPTAAPIFSPAAGTYTGAQTVTITSAASGASINYTTDGSTPTETSGTLYSGPVNLSSTIILKAVAYEAGLIDSPVTSGIYTITSPTSLLNVIGNFDPANNGQYPSGLVQGSDGNFYGTTNQGGSSGNGTVFKVTPTGILTALVSFTGANGANPQAAMVQGSDGNFYGTTQQGGSSNDGTVFRMTQAGVLTTLVSFAGANGANPQAALIQGSDGSFYGTTSGGGISGNGTVFKITPTGILTTLASFSGGDGQSPLTSLVQGSDGNFYGTTYRGGENNDGTAFMITPAGVKTTLTSFGTGNGASALIQGSDGNFYGTIQFGGTVFQMTPAGDLTTMATFNGDSPSGALVQGGDGNFYGITGDGGSGNEGTVFMMTPTGVLATLVSFDGANGDSPSAGLVQGSDGNFYGTTNSGGSSNQGVIFQVMVPPAAAPVFNLSAGTYANEQTLTITSANSGASIYYTTDGSTPTETNGTLYSGPVTINAATTILNAIAYGGGCTISTVTSGAYTITNPPPAAPVFSPAAGTYTSAQSVTITSDGATAIYYTTDGSTPTTSSALYNNNPVSISSNTVLQAIGVNGGGSSFVATANYTIVPPAPAFSPAAGTYTSVQSVTITSVGATAIYYTTDGTTPTESSGTPTGITMLYTGPVPISATTTLNAIGVDTNGSSPAASGVYTINIPPAIQSPPQITSFFLMGNFGGSNGISPKAGLIQGSDGRLYGTASSGGANNAGTVFAINADGTSFTTLHSFVAATDGAAPQAGLIQGTDGRLYGTASVGGANGNGTIFAINTDGTSFTTLYSFVAATDGATPQAGLIQGGDGRLYGTASAGGAGGFGTVFAIDPDGTNFTALYSFTNGNDGATPQASLIQGSDGRLYGTASAGGASSAGTVFAVNLDGTGFTTLYSFTFGADGADPQAGLIQGTDGRLYGTAPNGGSVGGGVVFAVNLDGTGFTTLYSFTWGNDGGSPEASLVQGSDGRLYGTAALGGSSVNGSVFAVNADGSNFATLYSFSGAADGASPQASLIQGSDGRFYGTASGGGAGGNGTVFVLSTQNVIVGYNNTNTTVSVVATGTGPLSYQWQLNGVNIAGATGATLNFANVNPSNGGSYTVVVTNLGGSAASPSATFMVNPPPPPAAPVFAPPAGAYVTTQSVNITSAGATSIYYTTDGSTPTTSSTLFTGPISISAAASLGAIGVNAGGSSPVATAAYTFLPPPTVTLVAPVQDGQYAAATTITFSGQATANASGASITSVTFFNGTTPLGNATLMPDGSYTLVLPANTLVPGPYNISMMATDSNGASASTAPMTIQVTGYEYASLPTLASLGESGPQGLVSVLVTDSYGDPLPDAPLTLTVTSGSGQISTTPGGAGSVQLNVYTNADGIAQVYANFPASGVLTATAQSGGQNISIPINLNLPPSSYIYETDFEAGEGYTVTSLDQQLDWSVTQGSATITNQDAFSGSQSVVLSAGNPPAQIVQTFPALSSSNGSAAESIVYVDFYAKPAAEADVTKSTIFDVGGARFAFQAYDNTGSYPVGILEPFNGDGQGGGQWIQENVNLKLDPAFDWTGQSLSWIRLTVRVDYTHQTWDLYLNGAMIAADVNLRDNTSTQLSSFTVTGDANASTELDAFSVGTTNPLFADANNDGIDDPWETLYGLSTAPGANDRNLDPAGNGRTVVQDYINGIDPNNYYSGIQPVVTMSNNGQPNAQGLVSVQVTDANGKPLANAPVTVSETGGLGEISSTPGGPASPQLTLTTDANGLIQVYDASPGASTDTVTATPVTNSAANSQPNSDYVVIDFGPNLEPFAISTDGLITLGTNNIAAYSIYGATYSNLTRWRAGTLIPLHVPDSFYLYTGGKNDWMPDPSSRADWYIGDYFGHLTEVGGVVEQYTWSNSGGYFINKNGWIAVNAFDGYNDGTNVSAEAFQVIWSADSDIPSPIKGKPVMFKGGFDGLLPKTDIDIVSDAFVSVLDNGNEFLKCLDDFSGGQRSGAANEIDANSLHQPVGGSYDPTNTQFQNAWVGTPGNQVHFTPLLINDAGQVLGDAGSPLQTWTGDDFPYHADVYSARFIQSVNGYPAVKPVVYTPSPSGSKLPAKMQYLQGVDNAAAVRITGFDEAGNVYGSLNTTYDQHNVTNLGRQVIWVANPADWGLSKDTKPYTPIPWEQPALPTGYTSLYGVQPGARRIELGLANYTDASGNTSIHGIAMIPAQLAVDANRDGEIHFSNENVDASKDDSTSASKPFRFWLNDGDDISAGGTVGQPSVPPQTVDYLKHQIVTEFNLENFTRLWMNMSGLQSILTAPNNSLQIGLKWQNVTGNPAINIYSSADPTGSLSYLTSDTAAQAQIAQDNNAITDRNGKQTVDTSGTFIFQTSYWANLTQANPVAHFLFEGAGEGTGQLTLVILDANSKEIGEGPSVWIDLRNIKEMYLRGYATPQPPYPYNFTSSQPPAPNITASVDSTGGAFVPDPNEDTTHRTEIVFVHGYNIDYAHSTNYAEIMFKRFWQNGYRGRFASFRWPTYGNGGYLVGGALETYNDSEYVAWHSGTALRQFVQQNMAGYQVDVIAHSMGNDVVGEALKEGMVVNHYALLHAATSASCYDNGTSSYPVTNNYTVPDTDSDPATQKLGYTGYLGGIGSSVTGSIVNFYDEADLVITTAWNANNFAFRPQPTIFSIGGYYVYNSSPNLPSGQKAYLTIPGDDSHSPLIRYVTDPAEGKGYVDQSLTGSIGSQNSLAGAITNNVPKDVFGNDHSYEWDHQIQDPETTIFYNASLPNAFGLKAIPLP